MIVLVPTGLLFIITVVLFFREDKLQHKRFLENDRMADEYVLREIERFLKEIKGNDH